MTCYVSSGTLNSTNSLNSVCVCVCVCTDQDDPNRFNLLIATDVAQEGLDMPKCNFVIRYNFVSNEIGSVQSKGRARAPNSECYLIVDRGSVNERREYENLEKEHLMQRALADINELPDTELHAKIATERVCRFIRFYAN